MYIGSCFCRFHVYYQESRNIVTAIWVYNGTQNDILQEMPTIDKQLILPSAAQNITGMYNGNESTIILPDGARVTSIISMNDTVVTNYTFSAMNSSLLFASQYRERYLYTVLDVQSEFEKMCTEDQLSIDQLPSFDSPTFSTDPLRPLPTNARYQSKTMIYAQHVATIFSGPPLTGTNYTKVFNNATIFTVDQAKLSLRPYCVASIDNVVAYKSLSRATYGSMLYDGQIRAYITWLPRLNSVASWLSGIPFSPLLIQQEDFTYQTVDGVNDTLTESTTATFSACSQDGKYNTYFD
jgi:hypothetical protein